MPHHPNSPTVLYNGMIAPLIPYAIRGVIWYQGESNESRAEQYSYLFPALIDSWRASWSNPKMPFYYVQIAPFGGGDFWGGELVKKETGPELRESQLHTLSKNNVGMAIITDIGDEKLIHPPKKRKLENVWHFGQWLKITDIIIWYTVVQYLNLSNLLKVKL